MISVFNQNFRPIIPITIISAQIKVVFNIINLNPQIIDVRSPRFVSTFIFKFKNSVITFGNIDPK